MKFLLLSVVFALVCRSQSQLLTSLESDFENGFGLWTDETVGDARWTWVNDSSTNPTPKPSEGKGFLSVDVDVDSGTAILVSPYLFIPRGATLSLDFWVRSQQIHANSLEVFLLRVSSETKILSLTEYSVPFNSIWRKANVSLEAAELPVQIKIYGYVVANPRDGISVDNIKVISHSVTPEPTTTEGTTTPIITEAPTTTEEPTDAPSTTEGPTDAPSTTEEPTNAPSTTEEHTDAPSTTEEPTNAPSTTEEPTNAPSTTEEPTNASSTTEEPTDAPSTTEEPTDAPSTTEGPTDAPSTTEGPTDAPSTTEGPTDAPSTTEEPTAAPTTTEEPTAAPNTTEAPVTTTSTPETTTVLPEGPLVYDFNSGLQGWTLGRQNGARWKRSSQSSYRPGKVFSRDGKFVRAPKSGFQSGGVIEVNWIDLYAGGVVAESPFLVADSETVPVVEITFWIKGSIGRPAQLHLSRKINSTYDDQPFLNLDSYGMTTNVDWITVSRTIPAVGSQPFKLVVDGFLGLSLNNEIIVDRISLSGVREFYTDQVLDFQFESGLEGWLESNLDGGTWIQRKYSSGGNLVPKPPSGDGVLFATAFVAHSGILTIESPPIDVTPGARLAARVTFWIGDSASQPGWLLVRKKTADGRYDVEPFIDSTPLGTSSQRWITLAKEIPTGKESTIQLVLEAYLGGSLSSLVAVDSVTIFEF